MDPSVPETYDEDWFFRESTGPVRHPKKPASKEPRFEKRHQDQKNRRPKPPRGRHNEPTSSQFG